MADSSSSSTVESTSINGQTLDPSLDTREQIESLSGTVAAATVAAALATGSPTTSNVASSTTSTTSSASTSVVSNTPSIREMLVPTTDSSGNITGWTYQAPTSIASNPYGGSDYTFSNGSTLSTGSGSTGNSTGLPNSSSGAAAVAAWNLPSSSNADGTTLIQYSDGSYAKVTFNNTGTSTGDDDDSLIPGVTQLITVSSSYTTSPVNILIL